MLIHCIIIVKSYDHAYYRDQKYIYTLNNNNTCNLIVRIRFKVIIYFVIIIFYHKKKKLQKNMADSNKNCGKPEDKIKSNKEDRFLTLKERLCQNFAIKYK